MPNNQKRVSSKFKTKQEIQLARQERDLAISNYKKQLEEAKQKEKEIIQLGKIEAKKFKEQEKIDKANILKETREQTVLVNLNKKEIKEEQRRQKEELKLKQAELANKRKEFKNQQAREINSIKERMAAEKYEAQKKINEKKQQDAEKKLELEAELEKQRIIMLEEKAEAEKVIAEKEKELLEQREQLRVKKAEAKALIESNKQQKLAQIRAEQQKARELELAERAKYAQRELEIKSGKTLAELEQLDKSSQTILESQNRILSEEEKLASLRTEASLQKAPVIVSDKVNIEDDTFTHDAKVFDVVLEQANTIEMKLAEGKMIASFGKKAAKLFAKCQEEPSEKGNSYVEKRNSNLFSESQEFIKIVESEMPISIGSIIMAVNTLTKTYTVDEAKELSWQFTAALLINQSIVFGNGYIVPSVVDGLRYASYEHEALMNEYAQFFDKKFETELNEVIADKLENGSAIMISKNMLIKKQDDKIKVLVNTPYMLA